MMNAHTKILKNHPSFSDLSTRVLNRLTQNSRVEEAPKGAIVCREGESCDALFILLSGRCQSVLLLPDGGSQVLDIYGPGDSFGERALLSHDRHWTTVQVITDSVLLRLDREDVHALIDKSPGLARKLVNRLRRQMRHLSEEVETLEAELGRVVAVSCVSEDIHGATVAENLSLALWKETAARVLFVHVVPGEGRPRLADWQVEGPKESGFRYAEHTVEGHEGVLQLSLFSDGGGEESRRVASLIGHMARHFRYVVISADLHVEPPVVQEFQQQSDLSYILFGQTPEDLYRANLFIREIRGLLGDTHGQVRPVVCLHRGERCRPFPELAERLGSSIHAEVHGIPAFAKASDTHYLHNPTDRFSANIRYLAREIGRCRIGIALSSGGAKGFAHIGVLQVLEANDIHVDVIVGSSMGSYIGALRAYGLNGAQMEKLALQMEGRFGMLKVMDPAMPPRRGFMKGNKFRRLLEKTIGDATFSDMSLQLRVVTTDLGTLERVVYDSGPVSPVVQASMAMPGVVVPVAFDGRILVDGGASDPLPVNVLTEMGVERIVAVNTIPSPEEMKECVINARDVRRGTGSNIPVTPALKQYLNYFEEGNILDIIMRSMHAIQTRVVEGACKQADVVLRPVVCDGMWHEYGKPRRYLELGRRVAEENLDALKALVNR
jgi:NTE family protein